MYWSLLFFAEEKVTKLTSAVVAGREPPNLSRPRSVRTGGTSAGTEICIIDTLQINKRDESSIE